MKKVLSFALSALLIAAILYKLDFILIFASLRSIDISTLIICSALIVANLNAVAFRLQRIYRHFGNKIPFFVAFHASLSGLIAGLFMINIVGAVIGRQVVLRAMGISAALSTFISGYERVVLAVVGGVFAFSGGMLLAGHHMLEELFKGLPIVPMIIALALIGIGVLMTARTHFEKDVIQRLSHPQRIIEVSEIFAISMFSQLLNIYVYTMILSAMGFDLPFWKVMAASAMVSFAASLPISVNGWGVREIAAIYAFGFLGVDASSATALSIAVGLLNTLIVVISAPAFALSRHLFAARISKYRSVYAKHGAADFSEIHSSDQLDFQKISSFSLGMCLPILLYFQFPVNVSGTTLTVNLGDIFALLGLGLLVSQISLSSGVVSFRVHREVLLWLLLVSVAIYLSLAIGFIRYGAIPWALGNRGIGWLVVLGYFGSGALFSGQFGRQGVRRIAEVLLLTAATVVTVHLLHRVAYSFDWTSLPPPPNFEGFSSNRNAFAFQLLITFGLAVCYLLPTKIIDWKRLGTAMAILVFATLATNSLTSYVTLICLAIVIATARKDLVLRSCIVIMFGGLTYVSFPFILNMLRYALGANFTGFFQELPIERMIGNEDSSVTERLESLRGGFILWFSHPILGGGLGSFISTQVSKTGTPLVIHSTYVWIIAEMGIVGLFLTGWIPMMQIKRLSATWWKRPKLLIGGFGKNDSAIFLLITTFCLFSLAHEVAYQRIFWFVLGVLLAGPGYTSITMLWPRFRSNHFASRGDHITKAQA